MKTHRAAEDDPIRRDLAEAVEAHVRAAAAERLSYDRRVTLAIDDCLRKLGRQPEGESRADA